jgi:hypothetical protein
MNWHRQALNGLVRRGVLIAPPPAGLYVLQKSGSRADVQGMTSNDEPIYETVMRDHNWDPERCKPLILTTPSVGRHVA